MKIKGRVWKFENDVNTDLIMPGKYLELVDPGEMAKHAMEGIDPEFPEKVEEGDILIAGTNFGCGSSREHAPLALKYAGVEAVIAESFARIFFRNAINIGLTAVECRGIIDHVNEADVIEIDISSGVITNLETGVQLKFVSLPQFMIEVLKEGGLVSYLQKHIESW